MSLPTRPAGDPDRGRAPTVDAVHPRPHPRAPAAPGGQPRRWPAPRTAPVGRPAAAVAPGSRIRTPTSAACSPSPLRRPPRPGAARSDHALCRRRGELVIIDQHAAHERVTLDRLRRGARPSAAGSACRARDGGAERRADGGPGGPHGAARPAWPRGGALRGTTVAVKQVPEALAGADPQRLVEDVADDLANGGEESPQVTRGPHPLHHGLPQLRARGADPVSLRDARAPARAGPGGLRGLCPWAAGLHPHRLRRVGRRFHRS